ncbi:TPA_asm: hypothetical protein GNB58_003502 [Salmonella enterica subsp. houtenae serovar 45:g,z51:-]|uniref:Uncharacterized protein n=1 Tax=Salmonella enterica subsp. houtenae serovar 45:g,z51:- TaxID=1967611 RepID=A0A736RJC4_SALHO|nr:hypothetical protein [Salmonella enterica subsp. houtenae serovar 45:g,z51:-]
MAGTPPPTSTMVVVLIQSDDDHWTGWLKGTGALRSAFRNNPAAVILPPCCPLTFNFAG